MNVKKVSLAKHPTFDVEGECSFCKKVGTFNIIITTSASYAKTRKEDVGVIFPWSAEGVTKHHIELFIMGGYEKLKRIKWYGMGFPRLMLACKDCFRQRKEDK